MTKHKMKRRDQADLAGRLREIREDLYRDHGGQFLADALEIPLQTWLNYESGIMVPAYVVLRLIEVACVDPHWLLTGDGEKYNQRSEDDRPGIGLF